VLWKGDTWNKLTGFKQHVTGVGGDSGSNKWKRGYGGAYGGVGEVCLWRESGQAVGFVFVRLAGICLQSP
jgi:hypothetical protein